MSIFFVALASVLNFALSQGSIQQVYNLNFNFQRNCSMTINWTAPAYQHKVSRYIVQSAQGCPDTWKNHPPVDASVHSMVIQDLALVTACLLGTCHIRVAAELDRPSGETTFSHCVKISSSFYNSTIQYTHYSGETVCLPIRTECPTLPTFYVGEQVVLQSSGDYYLNGNQLCIRNNSDTNLVVHEVCHFDTMCSLCLENDGELVLMTRTEVQAITSNNNISNAKTMQDYDVPSVVKFASTSFTYDTDDNWVEVCIYLPLYELHSHNADGIIMVVLIFHGYNSGTTVNLNLNASLLNQCFDLQVPIRDFRYTHNSFFKMCLTLRDPTDATKCVYIPEPCVEIISNNTRPSQGMNDTTSSKTVTVTTSSGSSSATTPGPDLINVNANDAEDEAAIQNLSTGTIAGVVVTVVLILIVIIIAAVCLCKIVS